MNQVFNQLDESFRDGGTTALLSAAEQHLRDQQRQHELFEILKMQARQRLGLPLLHDENSNDLSEADQRALEDGLLQACRDVGLSLLRAGQIQESWLYLKHLADNRLVLAELEKIEANDDNLDQILALLLHEGLDTERGFRLVLERYGTCNAITTMQSTMYGRSKGKRQAAGRLLVAHVHAELLENVKSHIEREENKTPESQRLTELVGQRSWLFAEGAYHIDTSHLSSTVQIAGELVDKPSLQRALDLTAYGQRLASELQYAGDPPFEDIYPSYAKFFSAQLGHGIDEAIAFFKARAESTDAHHDGTHTIEVYVDLLSRLGKPNEAIEATIAMIPAGVQTSGRAPNLYDLSKQLGDFGRFQEVCRERADFLGYVLALKESAESRPSL